MTVPQTVCLCLCSVVTVNVWINIKGPILDSLVDYVIALSLS